ncbi:MAG: NAD(P)/FAD-dependent oxidoreductase [Rhodospirillaceae bacterium]|nr:NAD(P)/FAD-dependent oxidoreductase [Rhodospirillaceae bacterium]
MNQVNSSYLDNKERDQVEKWLETFTQALENGQSNDLRHCFSDNAHWRDLLAFTWSIAPFEGQDAICRGLIKSQSNTKASHFSLADNRTPPRKISRLGEDVIEGIFTFETALGRGEGVVRLLADEPSKAWIFLTTLFELRGFEEKQGARRPSGEAYSRNFGGSNWLDQRELARAFQDRDPQVLVIGGGQAGLAVAARLGQLDIDALVIDKHERIGDNWRKRYHSLALHNQIHVNHLPYMPFPPTWPKYIPKDMLANWFEAYSEALQINYWTSSEFVAGKYDDDKNRWEAVIKQKDGTNRTLYPSHVIFANGVSGIPYIPKLPGLENFKGPVVHSHSFTHGAEWTGKQVLVLGTGNSGHDVAQDLHSHGVETTIMQRGSTTVVSIDPSAKLNYALYDEGPPIEDCDLIASVATYPLVVKGYQMAVKKMAELDKELIAALIQRGFKYDLGEDQTGHQMKYRRRGGGYYLDAGCSQLIIDEEISLLQFDNMDEFIETGMRLKNGEKKQYDAVILATGYYTQKELVKRLLGNQVAENIGEVWGVGEDGEMANMWKKTSQKGLWFMAGSLAQCRIYSKYLALQIKAIEEKLVL